MLPSGNSPASSSFRLRCRSREYSGIGSWGGRGLSLADYAGRRAISEAWEATAARPGALVDCPLIAQTLDYAKLVEAYGGAAERVTKPAEVQAAIERALATLASGGSARLDVFGEP